MVKSDIRQIRRVYRVRFWSRTGVFNRLGFIFKRGAIVKISAISKKSISWKKGVTGRYEVAEVSISVVSNPVVSASLSKSHNSDKPIQKPTLSGIYCPVCGKPVQTVLRGRPKVFCSDQCRELSANEKGQIWIQGTV